MYICHGVLYDPGCIKLQGLLRCINESRYNTAKYHEYFLRLILYTYVKSINNSDGEEDMNMVNNDEDLNDTVQRYKNVVTNCPITNVWTVYH